MVLGNKIDLGYLRTVEYNEGLNWAKEKKIMFQETSALSNMNIESSMVGLIEEIIEKIHNQQIRTRDTIIIEHSNTAKDIMHHSCC